MRFTIALFLVFLQLGCGPSYFSLLNDIAAGNTESIRSYLENGGDANRSGPNFGSLLAVAIKNHRPEIVELLLKHGAIIEPQDTTERPFCMIIENGWGPTAEEMFKILLNHGATFEKRCVKGQSNFVGLIRNKMWNSAALLADKVKLPMDQTFFNLVADGVYGDHSGASVPFFNKYLSIHKKRINTDILWIGNFLLEIILAMRVDLIDSFNGFSPGFFDAKYIRTNGQYTSAGELLIRLKKSYIYKKHIRDEIEKKLISFGMAKPGPAKPEPAKPEASQPADDFGIKPANWDQIDPVLKDAGANAWNNWNVKSINWQEPPVVGSVNGQFIIPLFCQAIVAAYPPKKLDGGINAKLSLLLHSDKYIKLFRDDLKLVGKELDYAKNTMAARWNLVKSCYKH